MLLFENDFALLHYEIKSWQAFLCFYLKSSTKYNIPTKKELLNSHAKF